MTPCVAKLPAPVVSPSRTPAIITASMLAAWAVIGVLSVLHHEPWADEAHSWLLARDAGLGYLWTHLLHYEGTPGLWQTLLHLAIRLGMPYAGLGFISLAAAFGAAFLVMTYSPWPLAIRVLLPFTYYLCYQYAVIARSYSLLAVLIFTCAILFSNPRRIGWFTVAASLLAAVSLDGFILAAIVYGFYLRRAPFQRQTLIAAGCFCLIALLLAWSAWPAKDNQFVTQLDLTQTHIQTYSLAMVQYAFTGEWITTLIAIALSIPLLWRGRSFLPFLLAIVGLCGIHSIVYMHVWHFGALTLAWLFCLWIAQDTAFGEGLAKYLASGAVALVLAFQGYWSTQSIYRDWRSPYSGSRAAAEFLRHRPDLMNAGVHFAGFSSDAVKAYFSLSELRHFTRSSGPAYWDWSSNNHADDVLPVIEGDGTGFLLTGYKLPSERDHWVSVAAAGGYERLTSFEGQLFWRTQVLEPESFDLYRRLDEPAGDRLKSSVGVSTPAATGQLLYGFYDPESDLRWTARRFAIALQTPALSPTGSAGLRVNLYVPEVQIRDLGPLILNVTLGAHNLGSHTFSEPGDAAATWDVPSGDLVGRISAFKFTFDRARQPSGAEKRELAAMVRSVTLEAK